MTTRGSLQIPGAPTPDVYLAALGPQMLRLAGRRTAGTLTWMTGPKTLAEHVGPALREAAAEAGRSGVRGACRGLAAGERHRRRRRRTQARAAEEFAIYGQLPSYRAMLDREGYAGPEDAAIIGDETTVSDRLDELARRVSRSSLPSPSTPRPRAVNAPARCCERRTNNAQISSGVTAVTSVRSIARRVRE